MFGMYRLRWAVRSLGLANLAVLQNEPPTERSGESHAPWCTRARSDISVTRIDAPTQMLSSSPRSIIEYTVARQTLRICATSRTVRSASKLRTTGAPNFLDSVPRAAKAGELQSRAS